MSNNVLVTGGAGYIGSHVCRHLAIKGYNPITLDNLITGHESAVRWGPLAEVNVNYTEQVQNVLDHYKPHTVYHLAGLSEVAQAQLYPDDYMTANAGGTFSLCLAMQRTNIRRLVFASTSAVYGALATPADEQIHPQPTEVYGTSKLSAETIIRSFCRYHGFTGVALRFFNVAGAARSAEIGEDHNPETHLIPLLIKAALLGEEFNLYGDDYETLDGTCVRDFVHVNDIARAHELAGIFTKTHKGFTAVNLGTRNGYSVKTCITEVENITGRKIKVNVQRRRPGDVASRISCNEKAKLLLGWQPREDIRSMIHSAYEWHTSKTRV